MNWSDLKIDVKGQTSGQIKTLCPRCSKTRKKSHEQCLSVNLDEKIWNCHNPGCGFSGTLKIKKGTNKVYVLPTFNDYDLSKKSMDFFRSRGISKTTIDRNKITEEPNEFFPQFGVSGQETVAICFNYFREKELINIKYRGPQKVFKLHKAAEMVFYKLDDIAGQKDIIITEGEIDALSFEEGGYKNAVSVPNGASLTNNNLQYLDNCYEYFKDINKVFLATDNDDPGNALRDELARRIGREYCYMMQYPEDCKDPNDVLLKYGEEGIKELIETAKPYPIEGVIMTEEVRAGVYRLYEKGFEKGSSIGYKEFDKQCRFKTAMLYTITGIPSHGKSSWVNQMEVKLSAQHGWKWGIFSPEHYPLEYLISRYIELYMGKPFSTGPNERISKAELEIAMNFVNEHFYFIRPPNDTFTLDEILKTAKALVLRYGIKGFTIDPWNTIDHVFNEFNEHQYIERALTKMTLFKQINDLCIFLVAHPKKMQKVKDKQSDYYGLHEVPTLYDISGSSHFYNKTDTGICVYRNFNTQKIEIYIQKSKYKNLGKIGFTNFKYDNMTGRFFPDGEANDYKRETNGTMEQADLPFNDLMRISED